MTLIAFAELVTREVRATLPDVKAARRGAVVTWRLGDCRAQLDGRDATTWWLRIDGAGTASGPLTYDEKHDAASAHVAAQNIVTHF